MADFKPFIEEVRAEIMETLRREREGFESRTFEMVEGIMGRFLEVISQNYSLDLEDLLKIWKEAKEEFAVAGPAAPSALSAPSAVPKKVAKKAPAKSKAAEKDSKCAFIPTRGKNKGIKCDAPCSGTLCSKHTPKRTAPEEPEEPEEIKVPEEIKEPEELKPAAPKRNAPEEIKPAAPKKAKPEELKPAASKRNAPEEIKPAAPKKAKPEEPKPAAPKKAKPEEPKPAAPKKAEPENALDEDMEDFLDFLVQMDGGDQAELQAESQAELQAESQATLPAAIHEISSSEDEEEREELDSLQKEAKAIMKRFRVPSEKRQKLFTKAFEKGAGKRAAVLKAVEKLASASK